MIYETNVYTNMRSMSSSPSPGAAMLREILRNNRAKLVASALFLSCWTAGEALVPAVVGGTIDSAIQRGDPASLAVWLGALVAVFVMLSYGYRFGARIGNGVTQQETHRLRTLVANRALDPRGSTRQRPAGEVASLASSDADVAGSSVRQVAHGISAVLGLAVCAAYLLLTDVWLGAVVLVLVPLGLLLLRALTPALTRRTSEHQATVARASASVADLLHGAPVLRGVGAEREAAAWFVGRSRAAAGAAVAAAGPAGRLDAFSVAVSGLILAAVAGVGGWRVLEGELSPGALIGVLGVTAFLSSPLVGLVALAEGWARSRSAAERLAEYLAEPALRTGSERPAADPGAELTLHWNPQVGAGSERDAGPVPDPAPLSIRVAPEAFTAIVCADAGFPTRWGTSMHSADGRSAVDVGAVPLLEVDPEHGPRVLQIAPHQPHIFHGTVQHNVAADAEVHGLVWAAAGMQELVEAWPQGAQHPLDEGGANLSGGQRQRLVLARALAAPAVPRILVEPTTAVDSVTEAGIARGLSAWHAGPGRGSTLAVLTSSPVMADAADRVIFVGGNGEVSHGSHEAFMQRADYREAVGR